MTLTSRLYSLIVSEVTDGCYGSCLPVFPPAAKVLDVGIGNGEMIKAYHALIRSKRLSITGLDVNRDYLAQCNRLIKDYALDDNIRTQLTPVEEYVPPSTGYFDCVLFSMSFMLLDDPRSVLRRIRPWLARSGQVVFVQTMFSNGSRLLEFVKPRLKYVTTDAEIYCQRRYARSGCRMRENVGNTSRRSKVPPGIRRRTGSGRRENLTHVRGGRHLFVWNFLIVFGGLIVWTCAYAQEKPSSGELIVKAWQFHGQKNVEETFTYTNQLIELYRDEALQQQAGLRSLPKNRPDIEAVSALKRVFSVNFFADRSGNIVFLNGGDILRSHAEACEAYRGAHALTIAGP